MTNPPTGDLFGGADALPVELEPHEAATGVDKTVTLPGGRTVTVRVPSGVTDNMVLRLPGADISDPAAPKDIFLRVRIKPSGPAYPIYPPTSAPPGFSPGAPPGSPIPGGAGYPTSGAPGFP